MFPFKPTDELVFGTPAIFQGEEILDDLIANHASVESNIINFSSSSHKPKTRSAIRQRHTESSKDYNNRSVMHRDNERKRRQETSKLYLSLRSILPPENIKGKRSICDQVGEAVNYINYVKKKNQDLKIHRDKLKQFASSNCSDNLPNCVNVNLVQDGLEILITTSYNEFKLSRVMTELLERNFDVFSCVSTRAKGLFIHKILAETRDATSLDLSVLQERLTNASRLSRV